MTKKILFLLVVLTTFKAQSQIIIDNTAPYNTPVYLIDNLLLKFVAYILIACFDCAAWKTFLTDWL